MYGTMIKKLMKENGFNTAYELAKETGLTEVGLRNILNDKVKDPQIKTLDKIAEVLNVESGRALKVMVSKEGVE